MLLKKSDLALSHTTDMGAAFAEAYFGAKEYLVYCTD